MAINTSYSIATRVEESSVTLANLPPVSVSNAVTWTKYDAKRYVIATGTTNQVISLGSCTIGDLLFLVTNRAISVKISGGAEAIPVASIMVLSAGITALTISNASGSDATVDIFMVD